MKRNKRTIEDSIKNITLLSSTIITIVVATVIGYILIKTELNNFKTHIKSFKHTLVEREKFYIKTTVENLKNDIEFEKISILNNKKQRIKNQSTIAYNLASSLYKKMKNLSKKEQINLIKSSLRQISKRKNDINYFILDTKGVFLLNTKNPRDEGVNFLNIEGVNGVKFINEMINAPKNTQNYIEYYWYKPYKKITYSRHLEKLNLIIGSSSYLESPNNELKKKLIKKISLQNFNQEEFLFIYKINSLNNITTQSKLLIQKNINTSNKELVAVKNMMGESHYKGNDYILYENGQKIIYGTFLNRLRYFIAVGSDLSHINGIVEHEREISLENMYAKIIKLSIIIILMTIVFFIFSLLFTKKIEKLFAKYQNRVKQNEEKYALLFNHSNDAFIISEIIGDTTSILSMNATALKILSYPKNEILYQDFFSLFLDLDLEELQKEKTLFKTVKLKNKNGEIRTIELNAVLYTYENSDLIFASLRDITERTLLKEEKAKQENILIQKSKMASMGEMIGNIAHQWRQPLSQISGLFMDISSAYAYNELDKKYIEQTIDEADDLIEYMSHTIDDFRNFFSPHKTKEEFLASEALDKVVKIIKSSFEFYEIDLDITVEDELPIFGYANEYSQVLLNILSNAKDILIEKEIKNPQIKVKITRQNNKTTLSIEDNAGGIEQDTLERIFEPYFTTKYEYGTGIGLYMSKIIIEKNMDGLIGVSNTKEGAKFTITI